MAHIRSRKHTKTVQPLLGKSLVALAALAVPMASHGQQTAPEQTLPEVKVRSTADVPYKADKVSSPKLTQPLVDTPQTISVIKKEIIREQGAISLMEALRNTPGITIQLGENGNTSSGDTFQMRGFSSQSSLFIDGIRDLGAVTRDTFNIEQVEVSKGPAGAEIGRGASSGYVNLVTKVPQADDFVGGIVSWNTGDNKRVSADLNKRVGETAAFRLNVMGQEGGVIGRDEVENNGFGIAPSFAIGLGTPTRFYLYSQHIRQDNVPDGGVPTVGLQGFFNADATLRNGSKVDQENFYGTTSDFEKINADMVTVRGEHDFGKGVTLRNISRYGKSRMDRILTGVNALVAIGSTPPGGGPVVTADPSTWAVARTRQAVDQENEILANLTNLTAEFATGSIKHSLSTGLELSHEKQFTKGFTAPAANTIVAANLYNPDSNVTLVNPTTSGSDTKGSTSTVAVYAFDTLEFNKNWQATAGLRFERYDTDTTTGTTSLSDADNLLSWKIGGLYKPAPNGSIYVAYATSLTPPGSANFSLSATAGNINAPNADPQKTTNVEFGTKWDVLNNQLALAAALYRTEHEDEIAQIDPVTNSFAQFGKRRVQGVELTAAGQLTDVWQISAGLATLNTKIVEGSTGNNSTGAATRWSPKLTATLWTTYKLLDKWTVGGGARYVSEQKRVVNPNANSATQNTPNIPAYWVADAMVGYQATKNVSVQLNAYNLFDKFYINTLNNGGSRYIPGAPRSAMLSANFLF